MIKQLKVRIKGDGTLPGTTVYAIGPNGEEMLLRATRVELFLDCATQQAKAHVELLADDIEVLGKFEVHDARFDMKDIDK